MEEMETRKPIRRLTFLIGMIGIIGVSLILYMKLNRRLIFIPAMLCMAVFVFANFYEKAFNDFAKILLKYRWLVALVVFVLCLIFRLHGSSIGMYNRDFPTQIDENAAEEYYIFGQERPIRTDEWAVHTPTYFSQYYNDYQMKSSQMSISDMNMVLDYFAPVRDITIIGKPFSWGYLLFGNEIGLSWYWCSLMIILFMSALELFLILTRKNVRLSIVGMFLIGLSPVMQWWFIPHIPIVFIYAMSLFDIGYHIFTARKIWFRWLMTVLAAMAAIGFALSFFPSCQIISALVTGLLLIGCLVRDRDEITFTRNKWYHIVLAAGAAGGIILYFLLGYREDLQLLLNTVYPGKRISVGGTDRLYDLFTELRSVFLPYKATNVANNSEVADYIHFAPIFLILFPQIYFYLRKRKDKDRIIGMVLCILLLIQMSFMCIGFSETLAKITLFKYINRMNLSYGWTAAIFTIWSMDKALKNKAMFRKWEKLICPILYGLFYCTLIDQTLRANIPLPFLLAEIGAFVLALLFAMFRWERCLSYTLIGIMCVTGLTVNPLCRGISPITNHPLSVFVAEQVKEDSQALWMTADTEPAIGNFLMANGARVIGATNFYPDTARWEILDPEGSYDEVYNRYSNQCIELGEEQTYMELEYPDRIRIHVNAEDLMRMQIQYVVTPTDLHPFFEAHGITDTLVLEQDGYRVYRLRY